MEFIAPDTPHCRRSLQDWLRARQGWDRESLLVTQRTRQLSEKFTFRRKYSNQMPPTKQLINCYLTDFRHFKSDWHK
jgi:hypothetical protein